MFSRFGLWNSCPPGSRHNRIFPRPGCFSFTFSPQELKLPPLSSKDLRGAEAPLFHGSVLFRSASAVSEDVLHTSRHHSLRSRGHFCATFKLARVKLVPSRFPRTGDFVTASELAPFRFLVHSRFLPQPLSSRRPASCSSQVFLQPLSVVSFRSFGPRKCMKATPGWHVFSAGPFDPADECVHFDCQAEVKSASLLAGRRGTVAAAFAQGVAFASCV